VQTQFYGSSHRIEQKLTQERGSGPFLFQITTSSTSWSLNQLNSPSTTVISVFLPNGRFDTHALKATILAPSFKQAGRAQIPPKISTSRETETDLEVAGEGVEVDSVHIAAVVAAAPREVVLHGNNHNAP
jgi:hypothetical protein